MMHFLHNHRIHSRHRMCASRMRFLGALATTCFLLVSTLSAQDQIEWDFLSGPRVTPQDSPASLEQQQATIERAVNDIQADDVSIDRKVGAIMLLGKYDHPLARQALFNALDHREVRIRRAALISILEQRTSLSFPGVAIRILRMLNDTDPEIRRQISSVLPQLAASWRMTRTLGNATVASQNADLPEGIRPLLISAFDDADPIVRRNMLIHYDAFPLGAHGAAAILRLMQDADRQVRIHALRLGSRHISTEPFVNAALQHPLGEDIIWDRELARQLGAHQHPAARNALEALQSSNDRETMIEAEVSLFQLNPDSGANAPILKRMRTERVPESAAERAVRLLYRSNRETAARLAETLLDAPGAIVRAEAVTLWLNFQSEYPDTEILMRLLNDPSDDVRGRVLAFLRSTADRTPVEVVRDLARHERPDVRESALRHLRFLEPKLGREILFDFLIDSHLPLRQRALQEVARLRLGGWERIVRASLRDTNPEIQIQAAEIILTAGDSEGQKLLYQHTVDNPDSALTRYLTTRPIR